MNARFSYIDKCGIEWEKPKKKINLTLLQETLTLPMYIYIMHIVYSCALPRPMRKVKLYWYSSKLFEADFVFVVDSVDVSNFDVRAYFCDFNCKFW